jgi:hypothetical protein
VDGDEVRPTMRKNAGNAQVKTNSKERVRKMRSHTGGIQISDNNVGGWTVWQAVRDRRRTYGICSMRQVNVMFLSFWSERCCKISNHPNCQAKGDWCSVPLAGYDRRSRCPNHQFYLLWLVVRAVTMEQGGWGRSAGVHLTGVFSSA